MKNRFYNIIFNAIYQVFSIIVPIITIPYVSRILGAESLGINTYTQSLIILLGIIISSGILQIGPREVSGESNERRTSVFVTLWTIQVILGLISALFYYLLIRNSDYKQFYLLQLPFLFSYIFDISWFFIGLEKLKTVVFRNTCVKLVTLILILIMVKERSDLSTYIMINSFGMLIGNLSFFPNIFSNIDMRNLKIDMFILKRYINRLSILMVPQLMIQLYQYTSKFVLEHYSSTIDLSYFDQSQKMARIIIQIITSISIVLMPVIAKLDKSKSVETLEKIVKLSVGYSLSFAVLFTAILIAISPQFVPIFFGEEFSPMIPQMIISSFIIVPICLGGVFSNQFILGKGLYKDYAIPYIISGILGVLLPLVFRNTFNSIVAGFTLLFIESTICILRIWLSRRHINIKIILSNMYKEFIILFMLILLNYLFDISIHLSVNIYSVILKSFVILIGYIILSVVLKTETLIDFKQKIQLYVRLR